MSLLRLSDARGLVLLGCDATVGITDLVEQMHLTVLKGALPLGRPRLGRTRGITGTVYRSVRGITRLTARVLDLSLRQFESGRRTDATADGREVTLAAINGLWGDHLASTGNPLAIRMALRSAGRELELEAGALRGAHVRPRRRVAVLVHGLCMSDRSWARDGHHYGDMLEDKLGYSSLTLSYNSGLHVSENGEQLASLLEQLVARWPVPVEDLVLIGHSMGGLVARAACHAAERRSLSWLQRKLRLVTLGTPHHGAVLERGGRLFDAMLHLSPYAAPFARLGKARSAGITDLRFGNVQRADWEGREAHAQRRDDRVPTPLPASVRTYCVAASTASTPRGLRHALMGDGLVTIASAWGRHRDQRLALAVPASRRFLVSKTTHLGLLGSGQVAVILRRCAA